MVRESTGAMAIRVALIELLREKSFSEISITELVNRAGVSRTTYYRHYYEQHDVLDDIIDRILQRMHTVTDTLGVPSSVFPEKDYQYALVIYQLILVYRESRDILEPILRSDVSGVLTQRLNEFTAGTFDEYLERFVQRPGEAEKLSPSFVAHLRQYSTAGTVMTLENWILGGCQESPDEILDFLMRVASGNYYITTGKAVS